MAEDVKLDLAAIKARLDAATPGPFVADVDLFADDEDIRAVVDAPHADMMFSCDTQITPHRGGDSPSNPWTADDSAKRDVQWKLARESQAMRDAEFLAHARQDVEQLVARVEELESALAKEREFADRLVRVAEAAVTWKKVADDPGAAVWPFTEALDAAIDEYIAWHKTQFAKGPTNAD